MATVPGALHHLIDVFLKHCSERSTLEELAGLIPLQKEWTRAHPLFQKIRKKTSAASHAGDQLLQTQYVFEEACAKILHNMSGVGASFDKDIFFKVVPRAFQLARGLGISDSEIVDAIMA